MLGKSVFFAYNAISFTEHPIQRELKIRTFTGNDLAVVERIECVGINGLIPCANVLLDDVFIGDDSQGDPEDIVLLRLFLFGHVVGFLFLFRVQ